MNKLKNLLQKVILEIEKYEERNDRAINPLKQIEYKSLCGEGHRDLADKVDELTKRFNKQLKAKF